MELRLLSVNVALPRPLGVVNGQPVLSAIAKRPSPPATLGVGPLGLEGDGQADLVNHGGEDKAVYAYSSENWPWWENEKRFPCAPGAFGENLTLAGADETKVHIGDRFQWGDALLEISQPRQPCFKFQLHSGREDAAAAMTLSGRCGWYLRVIAPGRADAAAPLRRTHQGSDVTVRDIFIAAFNPRVDAQTRKRFSELPMLARAWRAALLKRD